MIDFLVVLFLKSMIATNNFQYKFLSIVVSLVSTYQFFFCSYYELKTVTFSIPKLRNHFVYSFIASKFQRNFSLRKFSVLSIVQ